MIIGIPAKRLAAEMCLAKYIEVPSASRIYTYRSWQNTSICLHPTTFSV